MPKVVYTEAKGLVQQAGSGFQTDDMPYTTVQAKTAAFTIGQPGVYTVTAGAAVAVTMPAASTFPGGLFTVRNGDAFQNFLTASASEINGTKVFKAPITASINNTNSVQDQGWKLTLSPTVGSGVTLYCDGKNFLVLASSGSAGLTSPTT